MAGLAPNSPLFSQELDEWAGDSMLHVSQRQTNSFWIQDKRLNMLSQFTATLSVTVCKGMSQLCGNSLTSVSGWIYTMGLDAWFRFVAFIHFLWLSASIYFKKWPESYIGIPTCLNFAYAWNDPHAWMRSDDYTINTQSKQQFVINVGGPKQSAPMVWQLQPDSTDGCR